MKPLCEALCIVHDRRLDEGRRCLETGELHAASGFVLCWTHARAIENEGRTYPLVCVKRRHTDSCQSHLGAKCTCGEGVLLRSHRPLPSGSSST